MNRYAYNFFVLANSLVENIMTEIIQNYYVHEYIVANFLAWDFFHFLCNNSDLNPVGGKIKNVVPYGILNLLSMWNCLLEEKICSVTAHLSRLISKI